jgi:hypothetical protein
MRAHHRKRRFTRRIRNYGQHNYATALYKVGDLIPIWGIRDGRLVMSPNWSRVTCRGTPRCAD